MTQPVDTGDLHVEDTQEIPLEALPVNDDADAELPEHPDGPVRTAVELVD